MAAMLDIRIPSKWYRRIIGGIEMICGVLLVGVPSREYFWCFYIKKILDPENEVGQAKCFNCSSGDQGFKKKIKTKLPKFRGWETCM